MSQKIRILDKKTINQIAAGEVVERPASVVKELLENALDANAKRIVVELESAGRALIRVTDDGDGMSPEDLEIAFEKHSTSKISKINDIYSLSTLGFRGEALASIAAVARVECITCDGKTTPGRKLVVEGGSVQSLKEVGCAKGTTIKVKDLFYNLPARYKYLKSDQTELAHVSDVVTRLAIYHHSIGFKLIHNGHELLNFPGMKNQIDNLVNIYGKELVRNLIYVPPQGLPNQPGTEAAGAHAQTQQTPSITGHIGKPALTRSDRSLQTVFVNGRYVECDVVNNAVKNAYRSLVMKNRFPFVILFIDIDRDKVDVNISPTKLQIKFVDDKGIYDAVSEVILETLKKNDLIPEAGALSRPQTVTLKAITTFGVGKPGFISSPTAQANATPSQAETGSGAGTGTGITPTAPQRQGSLGTSLKQAVLTSNKASQGSIFSAGPNNTIVSGMSSPPLVTGPDTKTSTLPPMQPLGQVLDTYIIAQAGDNLLIIDQHAAHERIMYEKIKQRYRGQTMSTQELLEPVELELAPKELSLLKNNLQALTDMNFRIDEMASNSFFIKGIPIIMGRVQEPEFIHDLINDILNITKESEPDKIKDRMIQVMACKAAIKAGRALGMHEIVQLLNEMYTIENPYTCAHGRPTIVSVTDTQLKKMFKRIV